MTTKYITGDPRTLTVYGRGEIAIVNSKGVAVRGASWDGRQIVHPLFTWVASPEMAERIQTAMMVAHPPIQERRTADEMQRLEPSEREGWEWDRDFDSVEAGGPGVYVRWTPGHSETFGYTDGDFTPVQRG